MTALLKLNPLGLEPYLYSVPCQTPNTKPAARLLAVAADNMRSL